MIRFAVVGALTCLSVHFVLPALAAPSEITVNDTGVFPESITSTPDGSVIVKVTR